MRNGRRNVAVTDQVTGGISSIDVKWCIGAARATYGSMLSGMAGVANRGTITQWQKHRMAAARENKSILNGAGIHRNKLVANCLLADSLVAIDSEQALVFLFCSPFAFELLKRKRHSPEILNSIRISYLNMLSAVCLHQHERQHQ